MNVRIVRRIGMRSGVIFLLLSHFLSAGVLPDWTFAVYMEAGLADMHHWALKNMNDMALACFDAEKLHVVSQIHIEKDQAFRYAIQNEAIKPVEITTLDKDCSKNIVDFMKWTVQKYPAKHYGLILWNHGFGILDPSFHPESQDPSSAWDVEPDEPCHECSGGVCPLKSHSCKEIGHDTHKGALFDGESYMNNAQMIKAFKTIKKDVLAGEKLDILGTDCCRMAMIEIAYQVKEYARFLVGSQNCELIDGWNYKGFFECFKQKSLSPLEAVRSIVGAYSDYYEKVSIQNTYTLSALDLEQVDALVANLNEIVLLSQKLMVEKESIFKRVLLNAREHSPHMCTSSYYRDLGTIYVNLLQELDACDEHVFNPGIIEDLKNTLVQGLALIKSFVAANLVGSAVTSFQGVSIYFPRNRIDASYVATVFGQETLWLSLLNDVVYSHFLKDTGEKRS
ncbi:MAG: Peptidase C11 clostripain [candidate division TM6 bacterium GW2011_GWF2_38_10]|nr:MAG: Peptidase C11 clostripain [candidate division TM6 bacterium GW2011_GWF2_38_10]